MPTPLEIVQQAYAAFGRGDIPALLESVANDVDWECVVPPSLPYSGRRCNHEQVAAFFAAIPQADDIRVFEPREFLAAGDSVTVLGWEESTAVESGKAFASEWVHIFTLKEGKVVRWRGFYNTAARYGIA
jgi:uncharacterized protein